MNFIIIFKRLISTANKILTREISLREKTVTLQRICKDFDKIKNKFDETELSKPLIHLPWIEYNGHSINDNIYNSNSNISRINIIDQNSLIVNNSFDSPNFSISDINNLRSNVVKNTNRKINPIMENNNEEINHMKYISWAKQMEYENVILKYKALGYIESESDINYKNEDGDFFTNSFSHFPVIGSDRQIRPVWDARKLNEFLKNDLEEDNEDLIINDNDINKELKMHEDKIIKSKDGCDPDSIIFSSPELNPILLAWRFSKGWAQLDIRHAFLQLSLSINDKKRMGFKFRDENFRFKRLPLGLKCGPAILREVLSRSLKGLDQKIRESSIDTTLDEFSHNSSSTSNNLIALYADNILALTSYNQNPTSFVSNISSRLTNDGLPTNPSKTIISSDPSIPPSPLLGLTWLPDGDFICPQEPKTKFPEMLPEKITRRKMTSLLASRLFDPLGLWLNEYVEIQKKLQIIKSSTSSPSYNSVFEENAWEKLVSSIDEPKFNFRPIPRFIPTSINELNIWRLKIVNEEEWWSVSLETNSSETEPIPIIGKAHVWPYSSTIIDTSSSNVIDNVNKENRRLLGLFHVSYTLSKTSSDICLEVLKNENIRISIDIKKEFLPSIDFINALILNYESIDDSDKYWDLETSKIVKELISNAFYNINSQAIIKSI